MFGAFFLVSIPMSHAAPSDRRVIVGSLKGAPQSLDPAAIVESAQWHTLVNLGVNLVTHDAEGRMVGEAARSWQISDDLKTFTFDLADGIRDSEGTQLDSGDWRATFLHLLRSGGSTHSFISEFLDEKGIETPNQTRLVLRLKKPYQTFMQRLTTPEFILVPRKAIDKDNRVDLSRSSGAYRIKRFDSARKTCILTANPDYRRSHPGQIEEVVLEPLPSTNAGLFKKLSSREWNFAIASVMPTDPDSPALEKTLAEKKVLAETTVPSGVGFVLFFDTPRLKSAGQRISLAKVIGEQAEKDMNRFGAAAAHQVYPPGFVGALPPAREKAVFDGIRTAGTRDDLPKKLIGYGSVWGYLVGAPQWVQKTLTSAGIQVESHEMAYTEYQVKQKSLDHDYVVVMTGLNSKDPAGSLLTMLSPKSGIIPDSDGKLEALLEAAVQDDPARRSERLNELSEALIRDGRLVPFVHHGSSIVSSPDIIAQPPSRYDDELRLADIRWRN